MKTSKVVIKISQSVWETINCYHKDSDEKLSFLHARTVRRGDTTIILACENPTLLADDCYRSHGATHLSLYKDVTEGVVSKFLDSGFDTLINIHNHPFSESGTTFSAVDDRDDVSFDKAVRPAMYHSGQTFTSVSVVLDRKSVDARITDTTQSKAFQVVTEIQCHGDQLQILYPNSASGSTTIREAVDERLARQDFIPAHVATWMQSARVAIAGAGGLGSILAEGILRLGFRHLTICDDDEVEISNLNRLQGIRQDQLGMQKVRALEGHLKAIAPDAHIRCLSTPLQDKVATQAFSECDLLIGALDNSLPRALLNHISVQYQIPYFDAGVEVQRAPVNFRYRLFGVLPGVTACMQCSAFEILDDAEIAHALLNPELEGEFRHRGYITGEEEAKAASVYALNLQASGALMTELINYLCGFRFTATTLYSDFSSDTYQRTDRIIYPGNKPGVDCPVCSHYTGLGDQESLPFFTTLNENDIDLSVFFGPQYTEDDKDTKLVSEISENYIDAIKCV